MRCSDRGVLGKWIEANYATAYDSLIRACRRILGNHLNAEDAAQQAIYEALKNETRFRGECPPLAYLLGIAKRKCFKIIKCKREVAVLDDDENPAAHVIRSNHSAGPDQEHSVLSSESRDLLRRSIRRIPNPRRRQIARLAWLHGRSDEEIMRILGLTTRHALACEKNRAKHELVKIFPRVQKWRRTILGTCALCTEPARYRCAAGLLCFSCKSLVHGNTQRLIECCANPKLDQPNPCQYCGKPWNPLRRGRCGACYQRWKKNGFQDKPTSRRMDAGKCACGCGEKLDSRESRHGCIYRRDHAGRAGRRQCACGCGIEIPRFDTRGRERRYFGRHGFKRSHSGTTNANARVAR